VAHKIGAPGNPEFAIGSLAAGGEAIFDEASLRSRRIPKDFLEGEVAAQRAELDRKVRQYRADSSAPSLEGRVIILIDDGLATGATAMAACTASRAVQPTQLILAVPVAPLELRSKFERFADEIVILHEAKDFRAVGEFYDEFDQVPDDVVMTLLKAARERIDGHS
jgi:putative phosphoribosyl transferase